MMWWNSTSGNTYLYFTDQDSSQWVQQNTVFRCLRQLERRWQQACIVFTLDPESSMTVSPLRGRAAPAHGPIAMQLALTGTANAGPVPRQRTSRKQQPLLHPMRGHRRQRQCGNVNTKTGAVVLTKSDVGLGSADNTSDVAKPISTATGALDLKAPIDSPASLAIPRLRRRSRATTTPASRQRLS